MVAPSNVGNRLGFYSHHVRSTTFFESEEVREYSRHCWNAAEFTIDEFWIHSCLSPISKTVRDPGGLFLEISTFGLDKSSARALLVRRDSLVGAASSTWKGCRRLH
jgi:hypothetical protein